MHEPAAPNHIEHLSDDEAAHLLQYQAFLGRIAFVADGTLHLLPVNYLAESSRSIVLCTRPGTKLSALASGAEVVFEVDGVRPMTQSGWSVVVRGRAREVLDEDELDRLRRGPLKSWAVSPRQHWIRIDVAEISGRRVPET